LSGPAGVTRIAAAFAGHGRRAALMPYLMGGFPDVETSRLAGEACVDAGADLIELGIPFSDPLADGPAIHAAATRALAAGVTVEDLPSLEAAVERGLAWARPDGVLLLSPAAPSFGRYTDYRAKAAAFAQAAGLSADG